MKQIKFDNNSLVIEIEKVPILTKLILNFLLAVCILMPIVVTYLLFYSGLTIGILISYAFFWGIGFFILRFVLWNTYGQEVITFNRDWIDYYADFKFFKDGLRTIKNREITYGIFEEVEEKGRLIIENETEKIETSIKIPIKDLLILVEKIKTTPNKG